MAAKYNRCLNENVFIVGSTAVEELAREEDGFFERN